MVNLNYTIGDTTVPWTVHPRGGWGEIANSYWALDPKQRAEISDHMARFWALSENLTAYSSGHCVG